MRLSGSAPVTWPDRAAVERWWTQQLADLDALEVGGDGVVHIPDAWGLGAEVRLVSGTHLSPGASYVLQGPALADTPRVTADVEGSTGFRTARLAMADDSGQTMQATVDGLDRSVSVSATSTHPFLRGTLEVRPEPAAPLDLDLRLRWLGVRLHAEAVDGVLSLQLRLTARGLWWPLVAPAIAVLGRTDGGSIQNLVEAWAGELTAVAEGREPTVSDGKTTTAPRASRPLTRDDLRLRWLRSPRTLWKHLRSAP
ncbi:hypothetical protein GCM10011519_26110 [Marmoricola endophyticus]|uniref:Uncharacterized protein n=1 Tax=Marmoricola endophyticus TaxID=2040280 RepID=A0A917BNL5_9ACTN|nr:hypothetical protein [Marmoricola endophyticus]GGF50907.1 hypothetical protein GCM10011519_26110 [Marmoricola endophyticus]